MDDLITLKRGQAIARIGAEIVRFNTLPPSERPEGSFRDAIVAESRRRYCRPIKDVRRAIRGRGLLRLDGFTGGTDTEERRYDEKDFKYDTF